jgi:hypothetical protein
MQNRFLFCGIKENGVVAVPPWRLSLEFKTVQKQNLAGSVPARI